MKTMHWLIRRELWEHKGMLFWAPAAVGAIMTLFAAAMLFSGVAGNDVHVAYTINGHQGTLGDALDSFQLSGQKAAMLETMAGNYMAASAPVYLMLGFLVFFYCLGALHDERRDRSLLFWKSLPVSDRMTVLSKVVLALAVTPAIIVAVGTLASLLMLLMLCAALAVKGANLFGSLLATPAFYLSPLRVAGLLPVYFLWSLPTVGWLLMVSAWARSKVFLWAVGAPILTGVLALWANRAFELGWDINWFLQNVIARALLGVAPGSWFLFDNTGQGDLVNGSGHADLATIFTQSWATLGSASLWLGVAAGAAMIAAAIRLRRTREES